MMNQKIWEEVNQDLIAKSIGELTFEQVLNPTHTKDKWTLKLESGVVYTFTAEMSIWDYLKVVPSSIKRNNELTHSAAQFFIDTQNETKMDDIILGNFLEEMHNTLYSDLKLKENTQVSVSEAAELDGEKVQTILGGHPKILLNKGRIGFGAKDLENFAPEYSKAFQLHWVAIKKSLLTGSLPSESILDESFDKSSKDKLIEVLKSKKIDQNNYAIMPTHPWQWDHFLSIQFAGMIYSGEIISLGIMGDTYCPQISIRTLSNVSRPEKLDIKLPLTILNTSCIRGLPATTIELGSKVSVILEKICQTDPVLVERNVEILKEVSGAAFVHPDYKKIKNAPYRYHEYFGAIWRESAKSKTKPNELSIITATLFFQDKDNKSLIGEYIKRSGLTTEVWLQEYFNTVVIPLYHLQVKYGVGLVAHGQNIILKLKNYVPSGLILKDFQGDLRLSSNMPDQGMKLFNEISKELTKLPPHYLIHDLITGHFITVLRFISLTMKESDDLEEIKFYEILANVIKKYTKDKIIPNEQNLLREKFERVLLNKVRFKIGYSDTAERPLPMVGSELNNPLLMNTK